MLQFDLEDYASEYRATRNAYLKAVEELKNATSPYKAARDAYLESSAAYNIFIKLFFILFYENI